MARPTWSGDAEMAALPRVVTLVILAPLLSAGLGGAQRVTSDAGRAPVTATAAAPSRAIGTFRSTRTYPAVAEPVRMRIPAVRINTSLLRLGRRSDGAIAVPGRPDIAGWYKHGPRPGQPGPAAILGHVDSRHGPGVFIHLTRLSVGAVVHVDRADGSTVRFRVTRVSRVPKSRFPTAVVYAPTLQPSLRLVTCGGDFDHDRRSYKDNVIVYAVPA